MLCLSDGPIPHVDWHVYCLINSLRDGSDNHIEPTQQRGDSMREIDININQARILSYSVTLGDDLPGVNATIGLFRGDKKISEFSLNTSGCYQGLKFDLPAKMIAPIVQTAKQLEEILTLECSRSMGELGTGDIEVSS